MSGDGWRWTSVRSELPSDESFVLVLNPGHGPAMLEARFLGHWRESAVFGKLPLARDRDGRETPFTHWAPLPPFPLSDAD